MPTFMDHVRELVNRFFAVAIIFILFAAAAYPFFDHIANFLLAPLGKDHQLVYLTPGGAFSFIIQVCLYVGLVVALPAIIYNIYKFIMPAMKKTTARTAIIYTVVSLTLAVGGMLFAYYVSLPAALYFLTGFNLYNINPMLTIDSYFSFVMTYMIAGALLFQLPLLMLIINGATPLKPKKLMHHQDKIILGSFIVAAIISPTPDALNQTLLAAPIVVMYQAGIIVVWLRNRKKNRLAKAAVAHTGSVTPVAAKAPTPVPVAPKPVAQPAMPIQPVRSMDGMIMPQGQLTKRLPQLSQNPSIHLSVPQLASAKRDSVSDRNIQVPRRQSVDGFLLNNVDRSPVVRLDEARLS